MPGEARRASDSPSHASHVRERIADAQPVDNHADDLAVLPWLGGKHGFEAPRDLLAWREPLIEQVDVGRVEAHGSILPTAVAAIGISGRHQ